MPKNATDLKIECVHTERDLTDLRPEWDALCESIKDPLPFETWQWASVWWKHLTMSSHLVRDKMHIKAIRDTDGTLVAVAPMMMTVRPGLGVPAFRQVQFLGADPLITEIRRMPCRPGFEIAAHRALGEWFRQRSSQWDWITWSGLGPDAAEDMADQPRTSLQKETEAFLLPLGATWDEFRGGLKRNIKESIRKCYNAPKRDGVVFDFEAVEDPIEVVSAVQEFLVLHRSRALKEGSTNHRNVFSDTTAQTFLSEIGAELASSKAIRVFRLLHEGQLVGTRIGFIFEDRLFLYYSGYADKWGKYSAMTRLLSEILKWGIDRGMTVAHLSTGRDVSKLRWGPTIQTHAEYIEVSSHPRGRLAYRAFMGIRTLASTGVLDRFRRRSSRGINEHR